LLVGYLTAKQDIGLWPSTRQEMSQNNAFHIGQAIVDDDKVRLRIQRQLQGRRRSGGFADNNVARMLL
jgi:hypothetical protein